MKGLSMRNKNAFTLVEILVALAVVGVLATMTVPRIAEDINRKILTNQLKNTYLSIQNLVNDQLITNKTTSVTNTSLATGDDAIAKFQGTKCTTDVADCWPDTYNEKAYKSISSLAKQSIDAPNYSTILVKTGALVAYKVVEDNNCYGMFTFDINGKDKPNILGRDFYTVYVTYDGKLVDKYACSNSQSNKSKSDLLEDTRPEKERYKLLRT